MADAEGHWRALAIADIFRTDQGSDFECEFRTRRIHVRDISHTDRFTMASHERASHRYVSHRHVPWACMGLHLIGIEFMSMRLMSMHLTRGSHRHVLVLVSYPALATSRAV
jgi:hypothetical protein